jgi:Type II secretion system (T2SS), protein E, N-terminal domain
VSLRSRLPLLGDDSPRGAADVSPSGSPGVADELTPQTERKGEMSSLESSGFPPPPAQSDEGAHIGAAEPFAPPPPAPLQPFDEVQPLQPVDAPPAVESYPLQSAEPPELQPVQQIEPLQPLQPLPELEPLQPTMPPPLPLLTGAEPANGEVGPAMTPPAPSSEEVANLGVPLGTLIFRAGLLTEEQLEDALQEGVRSGKRLGEVLLEGGLIDERDLGRLLADQKGLRYVELSSLALDPAATALLSAEKAHMFAAMPVGFEEGVPVVAVADPSNELVTENLRRALDSDPRLVVASRSDLHATIDRLHGTAVEEPVVEEPAPEPIFVAVEPEPAVEHVPVPEPVVEPQAEVAFAPPAPEPEPQPAVPAEVPPLVTPVEVEPVAVEPVAVEPVAVEPVAVEPAAPVVSEPAPAPEPVLPPTPEPALVPVQVEHVAPLVPETPEAVTAPEPVVPEPAPVPVAPEPEPVLPLTAEPAPEPTYSRVEEPQSEPMAGLGAEQELPSAVSYDVSLRIADGERVPIGSFGDPQKAREYAREVVRHLSDETDGWPFFSGRFLRPDTIVSVDIVPVGEPDRWLGSSIRSNWASRLNR